MQETRDRLHTRKDTSESEQSPQFKKKALPYTHCAKPGAKDAVQQGGLAGGLRAKQSLRDSACTYLKQSTLLHARQRSA